MAQDIYIISPTDNLSREFTVSPYTSNGNISPILDALDPKAVTSNTSLLFHGKGSDAYGERIQENFYHLLENFSSKTEPLNPINGQLWFDNNDNILKIFKYDTLEIYDKFISNFINYVIVKIPGNVDSKYFEKTRESLISRFTTGFKFDIFDIDNNYIGKYISDSQSIKPDDPLIGYIPPQIPSDIDLLIAIPVNTLDNIESLNLPGTSATKQTIGTWISTERLPAKLLEDVFDNTLSYSTFFGQLDNFDNADNRIINLADPIDQTDAVTLQHLESNFLLNSTDTFNGDLFITGNLNVIGITTLHNTVLALNNTILDLNDSQLTGLIYPLGPTDAIPLSYLDSNFVNIDGTSIMTGIQTLFADPLDPLDAATKQYVDTEIAVLSGSAGSTNLVGLNDVDIVLPNNGDILSYNNISSNWENIPISLNGLIDTDFVKINGAGTISSGVLKLSSQPGQNGLIGTEVSVDAATVGFVNTRLNEEFASILPNGDTYVTSGYYVSGTDTLVLTRSATQPDVNITGIGAGIGISLNNTNSVSHDIEPLYSGNGDMLTSEWNLAPSFPTLPTDLMIDSISNTVRKIQAPVLAGTILSDGRVTPYDIDNEVEFFYTAGFNNLQIFINGIKQIANTRGFQDINQNNQPFIYPDVATGLTNDPTVYSFNISVDGNANQLVQVIGSNCQTYGKLLNEINTFFINNVINARCINLFGSISIYSDFSGSASSISITDIDLISNIVGLVLNTPDAGIDWDYSEQSKYGYSEASLIQFNNPVPINSRIEFIALPVGGTVDINGYEV